MQLVCPTLAHYLYVLQLYLTWMSGHPPASLHIPPLRTAHTPSNKTTVRLFLIYSHQVLALDRRCLRWPMCLCWLGKMTHPPSLFLPTRYPPFSPFAMSALHHPPEHLPPHHTCFTPSAMSHPYPVWNLLRGDTSERGSTEIRVLLWGGVA